MSRVGHLSNEAASDFFEKNYDGTRLMSFWRIYQNVTICRSWHGYGGEGARDRMSLLANKLMLAEQDAPLEPICL